MQRDCVGSLRAGMLRRIQERESDLHPDRSIILLEAVRLKKLLIVVERGKQSILSGKIDTWPHCPVFATGTESKGSGTNVSDLDQWVFLRGPGREIVFLFHLGQRGNRLGHSLDRSCGKAGQLRKPVS